MPMADLALWGNCFWLFSHFVLVKSRKQAASRASVESQPITANHGPIGDQHDSRKESYFLNSID